MNIERSIGAGPRRSAEQACTVISNFVMEIAKERDYPDLASIQAGFRKISPTLGVMLATRSLGEPALSVRMPELQVQLSISYSPDSEDDLTVPSLTLLDKLAASDPIQVVLHSTGLIHQSLQDRLHEASSKHITFALTESALVKPTEPLPDSAVDQGPPTIPVQDSDVDPDPELGMPPAPVREEFPVPGAMIEAPAPGLDAAAADEPVISLDTPDGPDDQGYLGRPAID